MAVEPLPAGILPIHGLGVTGLNGSLLEFGECILDGDALTGVVFGHLEDDFAPGLGNVPDCERRFVLVVGLGGRLPLPGGQDRGYSHTCLPDIPFEGHLLASPLLRAGQLPPAQPLQGLQIDQLHPLFQEDHVAGLELPEHQPRCLHGLHQSQQLQAETHPG
jgi:hypothetical protein